jgi:hypothetical protein
MTDFRVGTEQAVIDVGRSRGPAAMAAAVSQSLETSTSVMVSCTS